MKLSWTPGLNDGNACGGFGLYKGRIREEAICLPSLAWAGNAFHTYGRRRALFAPELPDEYGFAVKNRSWTGQTVVYTIAGETLEVELRSTLPGPLLRTSTATLALRWMPGNDVGATAAPGGAEHVDFESWDPAGARLLWVKAKARQFVLVFSAPLTRLHSVTHRHMELGFARAGVSVLALPLMGAMTRDSVFAQADTWLRLVENPPLRCAESYVCDGGLVRLRQDFAGAALAPVPPMFALQGEAGRYLSLPARTRLAETVFGPYEVVEGPAWEGALSARWMRTEARPTRAVEGPLPPLPDELQYAGDYTWDERSTHDSLLSWRTWAPLVGALPEKLRAELKARVPVPTAEAIRAGLTSTRESSTGREWLRFTSMWAERGEILYDPDWYTGLGVSGLARAAFCADAETAAAARKTAAGCRAERAGLMAYFEIFHDWMLCAAWSDPRGGLWLPDCSHNGMEGMLGEARLRELEGDLEGADRLRMLSAKSAVAYLAAIRWPAWLKNVEPSVVRQYEPGDTPFLAAEPDDRNFGTTMIFMPERLFPLTAASRNPYHIAGHFPEYSALFRDHGPVDELRSLMAIWEKEFPRRYEDWVVYYIGADWRERFVAERDQEARVQAAVFYHLAPEVCSRKWILDQAPEAITRRFATPLNLAEELVVRADFRLHER